VEDTTVHHWLDPADGDSTSVIQLTAADLAASAALPLVVNLLQSGYYRVNYDEENWALIADFLSSGHLADIHRTNRAQEPVYK